MGYVNDVMCLKKKINPFPFSYFSKDARLPVQLQRAMAAEAEAAREARAKVKYKNNIQSAVRRAASYNAMTDRIISTLQ